MTKRMFTLEQIKVADEQGGGFCLACGEPADCVEPDATNYYCEVCNETQVFGAQELVMMGRVE